jgi:hypothetical protein
MQESCEKNKQNRNRVKYHQATGSRSYVAHLHHFVSKLFTIPVPIHLHSITCSFDLIQLWYVWLPTKQKQTRNNAEPSHEHNEELDAVEAFVTCHTSSKKGLSEPTREAVVSSHQVYDVLCFTLYKYYVLYQSFCILSLPAKCS